MFQKYSEETQNPSTPDMNDKTTKELVDGLIDAVFRVDIGTVIENLTTLVKMYGLNNFGSFLRDYADQSDIELPGWLDNMLDGSNDDNNSNRGRRSYNGSDIYIAYKQILASVTSSGDDMMENFITVKQYQLKVLKSLLNGAQYCESYNKCDGSVPIQYTNLNGNAVQMEVADFDNSALKTSDGMYIWLGDINNPQRYYVDINGSKRPNKLGVDVFTFDITSKQVISPEQNDNCTKTGTPAGGEEYRGLGCTGHALTDYNPDENAKGYWRNFK